MCIKVFPVIDPVATGNNIRQLRLERGLTVREMQDYFGFEEPRAIYKWQSGETLPSVDNLYALGSLFEVPMEKILVQKIHSFIEQQVESCCSNLFYKFSLHSKVRRQIEDRFCLCTRSSIMPSLYYVFGSRYFKKSA